MRKFIKLFFLFLFIFTGSILFAQQKSISGTIIAQDDKSNLEGVTVRVKGSNTATRTNAAGYYSVNAAVGGLIEYSFVGYVSQEYRVTENSSIHNVQFVEGTKGLAEVIVNTGYGIQKGKGTLNSQVITVSGDEIAQTKRPNFINSLAGRIPGATITSTTGMPGASTSIILRGPTSIDGNNQPVFVVDGLIIDNTSFEMQDRLPATGGVNLANRSNDFSNRAADINPEDIENVTVLKGPEATALYGSDGANGGPNGDLYITFIISNSTKFKREGNNLYSSIEIDLYTALLGGELTVDTFDGKVKLKMTPEIQNDTKVKLKGKGFPIYKKEGEFGDLFIIYKIKMPTNLTQKEKDLFTELSNIRKNGNN